MKPAAQLIAEHEGKPLIDLVEAAMREAFNLGQTYWQQADSQSDSQNRKSDVTASKFKQLVEDTCTALIAEQPKPHFFSDGIQDQTLPALRWISVDERLPEEEGDGVLVYTPPQNGEAERIDFDVIADGIWQYHSDRHEHFMAVGGSRAAGPCVVCTGPAEQAPYTHWMPLPAAPIQDAAPQEARS